MPPRGCKIIYVVQPRVYNLCSAAYGVQSVGRDHGMQPMWCNLRNGIYRARPWHATYGVKFVGVQKLNLCKTVYGVQPVDWNLGVGKLWAAPSGATTAVQTVWCNLRGATSERQRPLEAGFKAK